MVRLQILDLRIGVRVPASQPDTLSLYIQSTNNLCGIIPVFFKK